MVPLAQREQVAKWPQHDPGMVRVAAWRMLVIMLKETARLVPSFLK